MNKLKFIVSFNVPYDPHTGGIMALHRLVHNLCALGEDAYITTPSMNPTWLGGYHDNSITPIDFENTIIIYPEVIGDNPLGAKYVVRWLLYDRGYVYLKNDWIYSYIATFKPNEENKDQLKGCLSAIFIERDIFKDEGRHMSGKYCYTIRKGQNKNLHPSDAILIDGIRDNYKLSEIFNECEFFISYDDHTFLTSQAALCGCIPIVIPRNNISKKDWSFGSDVYNFGHAYGFEEIEHAKNTRNEFLNKLKLFEDTSIEQTKKFIKDCYKRVYGN